MGICRAKTDKLGRKRTTQKVAATGISLIALGSLAALGCATPETVLAPDDFDRAAYEAAVFPVLAQDCGFPACHGSRDRPFTLFVPGRTRMNEDTPMFEAPTPDERTENFLSTVAMVEQRDASALLLGKPLSTASGGYAHEGVDSSGRDVYQDVLDPSYEILSGWVIGSDTR